MINNNNKNIYNLKILHNNKNLYKTKKESNFQNKKTSNKFQKQKNQKKRFNKYRLIIKIKYLYIKIKNK